MLIPEYQANTTATLTTLESIEEFSKLRQATTDKLLLILVGASWDQPSQTLLDMLSHAPQHNPHVRFAYTDGEKNEALMEKFSLEMVPSVIMLHPHKEKPDLKESGVDPEWLTKTIAEQNEFYRQMFQSEREQAFRDIE